MVLHLVLPVYDVFDLGDSVRLGAIYQQIYDEVK